MGSGIDTAPCSTPGCANVATLAIPGVPRQWRHCTPHAHEKMRELRIMCTEGDCTEQANLKRDGERSFCGAHR